MGAGRPHLNGGLHRRGCGGSGSPRVQGHEKRAIHSVWTLSGLWSAFGHVVGNRILALVF